MRHGAGALVRSALREERWVAEMRVVLERMRDDERMKCASMFFVQFHLLYG